MITLYKPNETDFRTNGLGVLDKYISDDVVKWQDNGLYAISFNYPVFAPNGVNLKGEYIVKAPTPEGYQLFRIYRPKTENGVHSIEGLHITYDLAKNLIEDTFISNKNGQDALQQMSKNLQFKQPFTFYSDIKIESSSKVVRKNPISFLIDSSLDNSFVNRWGGHIIRDNFNVSMVQNPARDEVVVLRDRKNVKGYSSDLDYEKVVTRIMPQGFDGLFIPEKYIDSPLIDKYPYPKIQIVEFSEVKAEQDGQLDNEGTVPLNVAYDMLREKAKECFTKEKYDEPQASYHIDFVDLRHTTEYQEFKDIETIMPHDNVQFIHDGDVEITANLSEYTFRPSTEEYLTMNLGNYKPTFTNVFNEVQTVSDSIPIISNDISKNHTDTARGAYGGSVVMMSPKDIGEGTSQKPFLQAFMNKNTLKSSDRFLILNSEGLGFIKGPFNLDNFSASWGIDGVLNLGEGMLVLGSKENGKVVQNTKDGLQFFNGDSKTGRIGVAGKPFPLIGDEQENADKALSIQLDEGGKFIKLQTNNEKPKDNELWNVTGLYLPKIVDKNDDVILANVNMNKKDSGISLVTASTSIYLHGSEGTHAKKVRIIAPGGLWLNNQQIFPGQGGGSGGGGGGAWNGQYPPELTSQAQKNAWQLYQILLGKGYSKAAACGILGNVEGEVGPNMNPDTAQSGGSGPGYGCVQWDGSAYPLVGSPTWDGRVYVQRLMDAANIIEDYRTYQAQGPLIDWCMYNGQWIGQVQPTSVNGFKNATDPQTAATAFELNFERPAAAHPERRTYAQNWYNLFKDLKQPAGSGKYIRPMNQYTVTSEFGWRISPLGGGSEFHNAIDLSSGGSAQIFASQEGEVVQASGEYWDWYGNYVVIKHPDGLYTGYAHLSQINVQRGQHVTQGQVIGIEGTTGPSTGNHLHFQFMKAYWPNSNDDFINPRQYVNF